jgi:hypothetical protein
MRHVQPRPHAEQLARQVIRGSDAGGAEAHPAAHGADMRDEFGHVADRQRGMDGDHIGDIHPHGHAVERLAHIIAQLTGDERVEDMVGGGGNKEGLPIRPCAHRRPHADGATTAGSVLHEEGLAQPCFQLG